LRTKRGKNIADSLKILYTSLRNAFDVCRYENRITLHAFFSMAFTSNEIGKIEAEPIQQYCC
jgi:hypothetical protein